MGRLSPGFATGPLAQAHGCRSPHGEFLHLIVVVYKMLPDIVLIIHHLQEDKVAVDGVLQGQTLSCAQQVFQGVCILHEVISVQPRLQVIAAAITALWVIIKLLQTTTASVLLLIQGFSISEDAGYVMEPCFQKVLHA